MKNLIITFLLFYPLFSQAFHPRELNGTWSCLEQYTSFDKALVYEYKYQLNISANNPLIEQIGVLSITEEATGYKSQFETKVSSQQTIKENNAYFKVVSSDLKILKDPLNYMTDDIFKAYTQIGLEQNATFKFVTQDLLETTYPDGESILCSRLVL